MISQRRIVEFFLLLICCALVTGCLFAKKDSIEPATGYYRADSENNYSATNLPDASLFVQASAIPMLDHSFSHWFRYEIPELKLEPLQQWYLQIEFPSIDAAAVYVQYETETVELGSIGDDVPHSQWPVSTRLPTIPISDENSLATTVFLEFAATGQPAVLPVKLVQQSHLDKQRETDYLWYGLFFGAAFALIFYNLLLYLNTRIKAYFYYVLYLLPFTLLQGAITGIGQQFFWPTIGGFTTHFALCLIGLTNSMMALFVIQFLELRHRKPISHRLLLFIAGVSILLPMGLLFYEYIYVQNLQHLFSVFSMIVITVVAIKEFVSESKPAKYLLISYSVLFAGILVSLLLFNGIIESNFFSNHLMEVAIIFEAIVLSYGLSDRISEIRNTAQKLEGQSRKDQELYTRQLISAHESEKQHFGAILHDDIGHRVLNLQYELSSLVKNGCSLTAKDKQNLNSVRESTVEILDELRHLAMNSHPHLLKELGLSQAIESLLQRAFAVLDIVYSCNINTGGANEFVEQQLYRIVQELVSNTNKHANASEVIISITQNDEGLITFLYKDDGVGMRSDSLEGDAGFGIVSIQERCKLIGGLVSFEVGQHSGMSCAISGINAHG